MVKRCQSCSATIDSGIQCDECMKPPYKLGVIKGTSSHTSNGSVPSTNFYNISEDIKKALSNDLNNIVKEDKGLKYDSGKPDLTIVPIEAIEEMARAFMYGARKYARGNFKKGLEVNRTLAAALRHIYAFANKEDKDPESGESHLAHALAALAMTVYNLKHNPNMDDR